MKHLKLLILITFILSVFFHAEELFAQNRNINTALEISKGSKLKYLKHGKKVKIWYEGQKYKVWIDSIGQNEIFTSEKTFEINKIDKIAIRFKATMITGSIIGTGGLVFTGLGTYVIVKGLLSNDLGGAFAVVFGIVIDMIGVPLTAIGTSVFFIGKKYKKNKGWQFKAVQLE